MNVTESVKPPIRPTVLVGYGAFGLAVLQRLLASTAPRGVLSWQTLSQSTNVRSLKDLSLIWMPDRLNMEDQQVNTAFYGLGKSLEVMGDLFEQIKEIPKKSTPELDLASALSQASMQLLSSAERAKSGDSLPLGLDVVFIAEPTQPAIVGLLDRMLALGLDHLVNNPNLSRGLQGSQALSMIQVLDFDNYWDRSDNGKQLRLALHRSLQQWQERREQKKSAINRCYLVDGRTQDGIRSPEVRIDEISLFLEFLLFEGQRDGELQRLYQPQNPQEGLLASFGVRMMERSAGLLSRLAGARFGYEWLNYLVDNELPERAFDSNTTTVRKGFKQCYEPYRPKALKEAELPLRQQLTTRLQNLEKKLLSIEPERTDWCDEIQRVYEEESVLIKEELSTQVRSQVQLVSEETLANLSDTMKTAIDSDLNDERDPLPLGLVMEQVEQALAELDQAQQTTDDDSDSTQTVWESLQSWHQKYLSISSERISLENLQGFWLALAFILAAALSPIFLSMLSNIPQPDKTSVLNSLYEQLPYLNNDVTAGILLFVLAWSIGGIAWQRRIKARASRAQRFYNEADKGRVADFMRQYLKKDGALGSPLFKFLDQLLLDMSLSVRNEIRRELANVYRKLATRRQEMQWLNRQLRGFLSSHGIKIDQPFNEQGRLSSTQTGIRFSLEQGEDFQRMLKMNPMQPERFQAVQAEQGQFKSWYNNYNDQFLYPLTFIDRLSTRYRDPFLQELAKPGVGPEQALRSQEFLDFLDKQGRFSLAFSWQAQDAAQTERRYCLLPDLWQKLPGIQNALLDRRIGHEQMLVGYDIARAYIVGVQTGVELHRLLYAEEQL